MALAAEEGVTQTLVGWVTSVLDVERIDAAWGQLSGQYPLVLALILIPLGLAFLLYGYRVYKALVILTFAVIGGLIGMFLGGYLALSGLAAVAGMVVGALVLGLVAWPLHRAGWGLLGGMVSASVFAGFAGMAGVTVPAYLFVIASLAFVLGAVLTIWLFKPLLIIITSLMGATLLVEGVVRLSVLKPSFGEPICVFLKANVLVLAVVLLLLAGIGAYMQWHDTRGGGGAGSKPKKSSAKKPEAEEE